MIDTKVQQEAVVELDMQIEIIFRDDGIGISKKDRENLFSEFGKLD